MTERGEILVCYHKGGAPQIKVTVKVGGGCVAVVKDGRKGLKTSHTS